MSPQCSATSFSGIQGREHYYHATSMRTMHEFVKLLAAKAVRQLSTKLMPVTHVLHCVWRHPYHDAGPHA